jgi:O-antigen ligase
MFNLLCLGLALIPFAVWPGLDTREPKMALVLVFALALSLVGFYQGKIKPVRNKWLLFLMGFLLVNILFCPKPIVPFQGIMVQAFWVWKPLAHLLIFFLMYIALSSLEFTDTQRDKILKVMAWVGLIMSIYCILQFFKLDQFYNLQNWSQDKFPPSARVGGTLGQPTLLAPFLAMIIPICLYLKKYWFAGIIGIALLLTKSQVAIGALIISLIFLQTLENKKTAIRISILSLIFLFLGVTAYFQNPKIKSFVVDSGRFTQWTQIAKDINSPVIPTLKQTYPYTGKGLGSFKYIYHIKNNNTWHEAHNDYLEILYNTGLIGLFLFLMALWTAIKGKIDRERKYLLASFVCIAVCAGATFCFQLGVYIFYTIVILALLNQGVRDVCKI